MSKLDIGLRQSKVLCQMRQGERLDFIAEGLPVILESARGFWAASQLLTDKPREADVLEGHAEEEAAKILILLDIIRCPWKLNAAKIGQMVTKFYDHLARLIYVNAVSWKPMHVTQLQAYADNTRKAHYLEGEYGEYIMPNSELFTRESKLYADILVFEGGERTWNVPRGYTVPHLSMKPPALSLIESLAALGVLRPEGVRAVADIWDAVEFVDLQNWTDSERLTNQLISRLIAAELTSQTAEQLDVSRIHDCWQMPMYNIDLRMLPVSLDDLQRQRDAIFYGEFGQW